MKKQSHLNLLIELVINAGLLVVISNVLSGLYIKDFYTAFLIAIVLTILNATVKPVLQIIALPFTIITLGIFALIVNGFILQITNIFFSDSFTIDSLFTAVIAAVLLSICQSVIKSVLIKK